MLDFIKRKLSLKTELEQIEAQEREELRIQNLYASKGCQVQNARAELAQAESVFAGYKEVEAEVRGELDIIFAPSLIEYGMNPRNDSGHLYRGVLFDRLNYLKFIVENFDAKFLEPARQKIALTEAAYLAFCGENNFKPAKDIIPK